jgi:hypothetical protein
MYEALGKSYSSYRKNLADIDKASIKSDLISYEAAQDRAFTETLGTTAAEIVGIVGEKMKLSKDIQAGRESMGVYESSEEYQPLGRVGEFLGLDPKERAIYKSRKTGKVLSSQDLANIGVMDRLGIRNEYSDYKSPTAPKRPVDLSTTTSASDEMSLDDSIFQVNDMRETQLDDTSLFGGQTFSKSEGWNTKDALDLATNVNGIQMANVSSPPPTREQVFRRPASQPKKQFNLFDAIKNIANVRRRMF